MSAILVHAVGYRGPADWRPKSVLLALAENADDFGFALLGQERIAQFAGLRSTKQVSRLLAALAAEGWLKAIAKAVDGCGSVYFLNRAKLGVVGEPKREKSPRHVEFAQRTGITAETVSFAQLPVQITTSTQDIPQGGQRTFSGGPPDISAGDTGHFGVATKEAPLLHSSECSVVEAGDGDEEENFPDQEPAQTALPLAGQQGNAALLPRSAGLFRPHRLLRPPAHGRRLGRGP